MSWSAQENAIAARFATQSTIATLDWSGYNLPMATLPAPTDADPIWARLSVRAVRGTGRPIGMGPLAPTYRDGLIYVQHFGPAAIGEALISEAVDETVGIFHRVAFSGVYCHDVDPPERVGIDQSLGWHQVNVIVPYHIEEWRADVTGTYLDGTLQDFVQASHGLVAGDVVRRSGSTWVKAVASAESTLGVAVVVAVAGDRLSIARQGFQAFEHGLGSSGKVYLSQGTSGLLTTTAPVSGWVQLIGTIMTANQVLLHVESGVLL